MNLKTVSITLLTLVFCVASAFAKGDITGLVLQRETHKPIDYADIRLTIASTGKPTSYAVQTDDNGHFVLTNIPDGDYLLTVSNLGSIDQERPVKISGGNVDLGTIHLADDAKMLQEVVVTGIKGQMSFELDRKVFNVDSNIAAAGASASELLESIPSVEVDQDGEVSLRGNSSVTIWINGKDSGLTADNQGQILEQIPAETIEKIEVITNPSAKYSPEGTAGIINIVLRKDRRSGYFGSAEIAANTRGGGNANVNINYNYGKFESFAGLGVRMRHNQGSSISKRTYDDGTFLNSEGDSRNHGDNLFLRLGTTYHLTTKDDIYLTGFGMLGHQWGHSITDYKSDVPGQWLSNVNKSRNRGDMRGAHVEFGYTHNFSDVQKLDVNIGFNRWGGPRWSSYDNNETYTGGIEETVYREESQSNNINNWEAKIDYTNQILPWLKMEAGYNGNYNHENSPTEYWTKDPAGQLVIAEDLYNRFIYKNNITALYLTLGGKFKAFSFSAGLRSEAWQVNTRSLGYGELKEDVTPYKKNNFALFPSLFLSWSLPYDNEMQINYTRRIRRPWGPQLNSFKNISDPTMISLGNPELEPEYSDAFEFNYLKSWTYHMISVSAYLRRSHDMISHISFMAPAPGSTDLTLYSGHANVGNQTNSGCEIVVKDNFFSILDLTTTFNLYNNHISAWTTEYPLDGKFYTVSGIKQDRFAWDVRCMASVRLPLGFSVQLTGRYNSRTLTAQGAREPGWDVQAGVRKTAGNWSFSVNCRDVFDSRKMHNITIGENYTQERERRWGGRTVRFSIKYSFGNMRAKRTKADAPESFDTGGYGDMGE